MIGIICDAAWATTCTFYRNLDSAMITGVELGFNLKPIYGIALDVSYGFTYFKTLKTRAGQKYLIGEPVNSVPKHKFVIKPSYTYKNFNAYIRLSAGREIFKRPQL